MIGLGLPLAVWILGVVTPPPGGWTGAGLALYSLLLAAIALAEWRAPPATAPVGRRLLWLGLEVALCFAVVRTHGTLIRPAFVYLVPACRALPLFGERRGLLIGLAIWPAYILNVGLDIWPERAHEFPNYLLILLVVWAAAVLPVAASLQQATARRHVETLYAELHAAHQALAALHQRAREAAVAEERNRLAREIHDTLAHYLTVVNVQLEAAEKLAADQPTRSLDAVGRARRLTLECLHEVRRSVGALRAASLEELALPRALARLTREFAASTGLDVALDVGVTDVGHLPPEATQALYRAAQEGLTNVQRHARAGRAWVSLEAPIGLGAGTVALTVEDDGVGPGEAPDRNPNRHRRADGGASGNHNANGDHGTSHDPGANGAPGANGSADQAEAAGARAGAGGFGLVGLRERVALLGGQLEFGARPGGGSYLRVTLPAGAPSVVAGPPGPARSAMSPPAARPVEGTD